MFAFAEFLMSSPDSKLPRMTNSMFDWPLASHTSPTSTSSRWINVFFPSRVAVTFNTPAGPGFKFFNVAIHRPCFTVTVSFWPANSTVTRSPSSPQPQTGTRAPCWSTM